MNMNFTLLEELCGASGISGDETAVRDILLREASPFADVQIDALGNILAFKKGAPPAKIRLMVCAHMDEVGFIVTHITDDGLLRFSPVGGILRQVTCGKRVFVGENKILGVIGVVPVHLTEMKARCDLMSQDELCIDIGVKSREEAEKFVQFGDSITFENFFEQAVGTIKAKALDDRAGCFTLVNILKKGIPNGVAFAFLVQEEVGLHGARTAAFSVNPEAAIVVDTTTAADLEGVPGDKQVCQLGKGAVLSFMDRSTIYDRKMYDLAIETAEEQKISVQVKQAVAGGNDAGAIHKSRSGVRTLAVSLPCRYLHTSVGLIRKDDLASIEALVEKLIEKILQAASGRYGQ